MLQDKKRIGVGLNTSMDLKSFGTIKEKNAYFLNMAGVDQLKVNFAIFNQNCQCVKIHKAATLFDLLKFVAWSGYRGSIDQILLKLKYCILSEKDTVYNICLSSDFNLNILILKDKSILCSEDKLAQQG